VRTRLVRLTLAGGIALCAATPFSGTSNAINCTRIETVCATVGTVCVLTDFGRTICQKIAPL
jgi:hypothetical protein